jgi:hypothetical protein
MEINIRIFNAAKSISVVAAAAKRLKLKRLPEKSPYMPNDLIFKNIAAIIENAASTIPNILNPFLLESPKNTSIMPAAAILDPAKNG